ncbi:unnamed protein product [Rhodiola kirilowii]
MSATSVAANLNNIFMLNGTNFKDWKENITILLGCMDLDLALREPKPDAITGTSSESGQVYKGTSERSNMLSLMIIYRGIPAVFRGIVSDEISSAKDYLAEFEKHFVENDKAKTSELLANLISMKYFCKGNVREHIMEMSQLASKLQGAPGVQNGSGPRQPPIQHQPPPPQVLQQQQVRQLRRPPPQRRPPP